MTDFKPNIKLTELLEATALNSGQTLLAVAKRITLAWLSSLS